MKPTFNDTQVQGDLGGAKTEMSFDQNSLAHLMSVLTDLYSDPEAAVIREYSTNARDSHVLAGITRPIEVSLPSALSPYFKVKDYGVGLSVTEITDLYSKYGASTKRDSNDFNGTLGLGGKSALTYTQQFTLIAVKNGVKTTVSVSRNEHNIGVMEVVDTSATTEPNGVEIIIPSRNYDSMRRRAEHFFRFWKPGTVLIDGAEPKEVKGHWVTDSILLDTDNTSGPDYVVMGGVAYPLNNNDYKVYDHNWNKKFTVVCYVEIGDVAFAPSREALQYTPATKATIQKMKSTLAKAMPAFFEKQIASATTYAEAIKAKHTWEALLGSQSKVKWNGQEIVDHYTIPGATPTMRGTFYVYNARAATRYAVQRETRIYYSHVMDAITITDYNYSETPSARRAKMRKWAEDNGHVYFKFILTPTADPIGLPWTEGCVSVSWNEVVKVKVDPQPSRRGGVVRTEKYLELDKNGLLVETSVFTKPEILYYSPAESNFWGETYKDYAGAFRQAFPDAHIVELGKNRWDKFKKDWPTAKHIKEGFSDRFAAAADALDEDDRIYRAIDDYHRNMLTRFDQSAILDPKMADLVRICSAGKSKELAAYEALERLTRKIAVPNKGKVLPTAKVMDFMKVYPLIDSEQGHAKHCVLYMNAIYSGSN